MKKLIILILSAFLAACSNSPVELRLPNLISDHMVLQRDNKVTIWGWCNPGKKVSVKTSWGTEEIARTDESGKWQVSINTPAAGGPYTMSIKAGDIEKTITDILIGEVWLCSGQSNMEMPLKGWPPGDTINYSVQEIANANYSQIRMFTVEKALSFEPLDTCRGNWAVCSSETAGDFSATAYFFGRELFKELQIPIGLIHSSWGGTPAESWTSGKFLKEIQGFENITEETAKAPQEMKTYKEWISSLKKIEIASLPKEAPFKGLTIDDTLFSKTGFNDSLWAKMKIPCLWETQGLNNFDGIVWFRKEFEIHSNIQPAGFKLNLGPIDDMDVTYINGVKIGGYELGGFWQQERIYEIPAGILKPGKNILAVRVIDTQGGGGIYGSKDITISKGNKTIVNLTGEWKYKPVGLFYENTIYAFGKETNTDSIPSIPKAFSPYSATILYNAMVAPLISYTIKGAIWYQGEANVGKAKQYQVLFPNMIKCWREAWGLGDFPFYYVQIAPYNYGETEPGPAAELREAQLLSMVVPNTGMVSTMDIGSPLTIHPGNKQDVGKRLANWALSKNYGKTKVYTGPAYKSCEFKDGKAILSFDNIGGGLISKGNKLNCFEIAGIDKVYYPANATIEGENIVVVSAKVKDPKFVRFAWEDDAQPNLANKEGLPVSSFRTGE